MSSVAMIILGNQLFPPPMVSAQSPQTIFMAEDFGLCTHYRYHKHKLIFFLAAMRRHRDLLLDSGLDVDYLDCHHTLFKMPFEEKLDLFFAQHREIKKVKMFEVEDRFFEKRLEVYFSNKNIDLETLRSPMFLTSRLTFQDYLAKQKKPFMKTFYQDQRKNFQVLLSDNGKPLGGAWSFDKENRKKLPKKISVPEIPKVLDSPVVENAITDVEKYFPNHPGRGETFWLPTDRNESLQWLDAFIADRLPTFGDYQDAITQRSTFVFHSVLSPMINAGLLLPGEVIEKVETAHRERPQEIPLNAVEGFIRQVLGWREFVRGIYQEYGARQWQENFWSHHRRLGPAWYDGSTGVPVLDDAIKKADTYAYNHHIERLMVVSNMMLLAEVHPHEVYKWFMEMFADSSDWVMGPNVFGMGQFSDGGIFATKPYTCGSNYYLKMGDYKKGDWCDIVDGLYWRFIHKHQDFYKKNPRMSFMLGTLKKMDDDRRERIFLAAENFIDSVTLPEEPG